MTSKRRIPVIAVTLARPITECPVTLLTLGSGLLNVYSVAGRGLPERVELLRKLLPFEVVHFSRSATLLLGFALVVLCGNNTLTKRESGSLKGY